MNPIRSLTAKIVLGISCWLMSVGLHAQTAPDELIRSVSQGVLDEIKTDRSLQTGDIERLNLLVDKKVLPYVDFQRMTALAVGRNWRTASPDQQKMLMTEFRRLLLLTYSGAVRQVTDTTIQVRPMRSKPEDDEVIVRTQILRPGTEAVQLDYRLQKSPTGWKIFDMNVMGLWLVEHYRNQFTQVVGAGGIDGLIQSLRDKNQSLASANGPGARRSAK
ncbi:MAG: ABC transporter substrate-binding protein [Burkholderiaceae bacterium]|nr:ABC transporter substrate-binding protein [Burkholderiaceae bacterium]